MADDRDKDQRLYVTLSEGLMAHYTRRAEAAGRTLEEQLNYELEVSFGLTKPDPGDHDAAQRGQLFRRMSMGRILQG